MAYSEKYPSGDQINEGVQYCRDQEGRMIWMLISDPGRYYDGQGREVSEEAALAVGFEIERFRMQRRRKEAEHAALAAVAAQFQDELRKRQGEPEPPAAPLQGTDPGRDERLARGRPAAADFQKITIPDADKPGAFTPIG